MAILEGIKLAVEENWSKIVVETDVVAMCRLDSKTYKTRGVSFRLLEYYVV